MGSALAATAAAAAAEGTAQVEAFYLTADFWVAVAFVILVGGVARPLWRLITAALDERVELIRSRLEEATKLREEAQEMLAGYKRKLAEAESEAEEIIAQARDAAKALEQSMTEDLEAALARRERSAMDRIAQAEAEAVTEVRMATADIALSATRRLLAENITGDKAKALIDAAIDELPEKLN